MSKTLTNQDYCIAAKTIGCDVAAVKSVAQVESAGGGFLPDGRCKILFERHWFHKFTKGKFDAEHSQISSRAAGGYYGNEKEYLRFNQAFALDPKAAMMSCSWGKFQIMGFNYPACGFSNIGAFVDAMKSGEAAQLMAFLAFVQHNDLDDEMRRLDWRGFARGYNGRAYEKNDYHNKMAFFYNKFKAEKIDCNLFKNLTDKEIDSAVSGAIGTSGTAEQLAAETNNAANETPAPEVTQTADQITNVNTSEAAPKVEGAQSLPTTEIEKTQPTGFGKKLIAFFTAIFTGQYIVPQFVADGVNANSGSIFQFVGKFLQAAYENRYLIFAGLALWYVVKKVNNYFLTAKIADTNADPTKGNIVLVDRERQPSKWKWLLFWT
jgi:hypothetical protein